jgi:carboxylesterase type B
MSFNCLFLFLLPVVGIIIQSSFADVGSDLIVNTTEGTVQGSKYDGCRVFYNVPYASPPIGRLRFAPPEPPTKYSESFYDASFSSPIACMQPQPDFVNPGENREDCLYLNIYTPLMNSSSSLYPVLVWIHGGSFFAGGKDTVNLTRFASTGEVVGVAINYRLGPFGFFRMDEKSPGVNGFLDQVQALKWIKENIANFGGDPNRITIAGESAGGSSVLLHLISPECTGLFHQAYASSPWVTNALPTMIDGNITATTFAKVSNCTTDDLKSCIQHATSDFILEKFGVYLQLCHTHKIPHYAYYDEKMSTNCGVYPEVDNSVLPGQIIDSLNQSANAVSSIMIGTTWNDAFLLPGGFGGHSFFVSTPELYKINQLNQTQRNYIHVLNQVVDRKGYDGDSESYTRLYSTRAERIYKVYPYNISEGFLDMYPYFYNGYQTDGPLDATYVYFELSYDKYWFCPVTSAMSALLEKTTTSSVYMFRFKQPLQYWKSQYANFGSNPITAVGNGIFSRNLYPTHSDEMLYFSLWDRVILDLSTSIRMNLTAEEQKLNLRMFSAFVDFIHTGDPNSGPMDASVGTSWEKFDPMTRNMIYLSEPEISSPKAQNVRDTQCTFWEEMNFEFSENLLFPSDVC